MAEALKRGGGAVRSKLRTLVTHCISTLTAPEGFGISDIMPIYKGKGNPGDCNSYRGIALQSVAAKMLARVKSRIQPYLEIR